jgi:putative membrane protein
MAPSWPSTAWMSRLSREWSLSDWGSPSAQLFFLTCVIVAGIFGAMTLKWTTVVLQSVPGALAWLFVWMPD